jgi:hypothetical protein
VLGTGVTTLTEDAGLRDSIGRGPVSYTDNIDSWEARQRGQEDGGGRGRGGRGAGGAEPRPQGQGILPSLQGAHCQ